MSIELVIVDDYDALSRAGADVIAGLLAANPAATLLLATGDTPMGTYAELARRRADGLLDASHARVFQLDAYLGLAADDRRSLYGWMKRSFLDPLGVPDRNVVRLPGDAPDPEAACAAYERAVAAAGGIDLAVLGLGPNGHLGFNEPPADPASATRVVDLSEASIQSNARYWGSREMVPRRALTAGMRVLLAARQTLLLVSGSHKRDILRQAIEGAQTPLVPASFLQRAPAVTVVADREAAGALANAQHKEA
jgi:glucosamine-6-phosphate deaminase